MMKDIRGRGEKKLDEEPISRFGLNDMLNKTDAYPFGRYPAEGQASLAFLFDPDVLIPDEPTAGSIRIPPRYRKKDHAEKGKATVLITSHIPSELDDRVTQVVFMQDGKICFTKPGHPPGRKQARRNYQSHCPGDAGKIKSHEEDHQIRHHRYPPQPDHAGLYPVPVPDRQHLQPGRQFAKGPASLLINIVLIIVPLVSSAFFGDLCNSRNSFELLVSQPLQAYRSG